MAEIRFGIDIETVFLITVNGGFDFFEGVPKLCMHFIEESSLEGFTKQPVAEVFKGTPAPGVTNAAFGNEAVDMGIPFEVTPEGMEDTEEAGSETFGLVFTLEHSENNAADSREKAAKQDSVSKEEGSEFFCDCKNTVPVRDIDEFEGHGSSPVDGIFDTAGRAEAAVASEGYKFKHTTGRASVHGTAKGRVPAMNHFFNIFDNGLSRMKKINHFFIMVSKNVL